MTLLDAGKLEGITLVSTNRALISVSNGEKKAGLFNQTLGNRQSFLSCKGESHPWSWLSKLYTCCMERKREMAF